MNVREIMTENPACCTPETSLQDVASMMLDCDCGAIPVVKDMQSMIPVGIITDRDITVRVIAWGRDPMQKTAADAMTKAAVTAVDTMDLKHVEQLMRDNQVRRLIVVDGQERCIGMVAQADVARHASDRETGEMVEEISSFSEAASRPSRFQDQPERHKPTKGGV